MNPANTVVIYVEGPSDKAAMTQLLQPLLEQKKQENVKIDFFETMEGDRKASVLTKAPIRAVNILLNKPASVVVAMPDLYPKNKSFPHETAEEMFDGIRRRFEDALKKKTGDVDPRIAERFRVFCFKHDLEALLLAAEDGLKTRLGLRRLNVSWKTPVEDQNYSHPPNRVIEELLKQHGQTYRDTLDAPLILGMSDYQEIADACPQCFKPFVEFIKKLPQI